MKIKSAISTGTMGQLKRPRAAFTLLEVVVAVSVVSVAFISFFGIMTMGLSVTQLSRENLRATQILLDKTEGVRLYSWTEVTNSTVLIPAFTNWFYETNNIGQVTASGNGVMYTGLVSIVSVPFSTSYSTNMVAVNVSVGWMSSSGVIHTRSTKTYVSQMGMQNYVYND